MKDFYKILEVENNATPDKIKSQYKILARRYHPDKGGDADKFRQIAEAYENLSDPSKKKIYDMNINLRPTLVDSFFGNKNFYNNFSNIDHIFSNLNINNISESKETIIRNNMKFEKITRNHNGKKIIILTETNLQNGNKSQKIIEQ